jgi:hypothetical protein
MEAQRRTAPLREPLGGYLSECVGFLVQTSQGLLGVVEEIRWHGDRAGDLVVRAGKKGRRLLILPLEDVAEVVPGERRVILGLAFHLTTSEGLSAGAQPPPGRTSEPAAKRGGVPRAALQAALSPLGAPSLRRAP